MKNKTAVIIDIDGTLSNNEHRLHHIRIKRSGLDVVQPTPEDWGAYNEAMIHDTVNEWCKNIILGLNKVDTPVLLVSGRGAEYMKETLQWLSDNGMRVGSEFENLYLRSIKDYRPDYETKLEIYLKRIEPYFDVLFAIDDRQQVVDMWRKQGIICLQCNKGDF